MTDNKNFADVSWDITDLLAVADAIDKTHNISDAAAETILATCEDHLAETMVNAGLIVLEDAVRDWLREQGELWHGRPCPDDPDNYWICDACGSRIPSAFTKEPSDE